MIQNLTNGIIQDRRSHASNSKPIEWYTVESNYTGKSIQYYIDFNCGMNFQLKNLTDHTIMLDGLVLHVEFKRQVSRINNSLMCRLHFEPCERNKYRVM